MSVRQAPDGHALGGMSYFVETAEDVALLPAPAQALLAKSTLALFEDPPTGLEARARKARFAPLRDWLRSLAAMRCELEVHLPEGPRARAMLRFHPVLEGVRALEPALEWVRAASIPKRGPASLREVYALAGAINLYYAGSNYLVHPAESFTARALVETHYRTAGEFSFYGAPSDYAGLDLRSARPLWMADGDVLFWTPAGRTFWLGREHAVADPGTDWGSVDDALERLFRSLIANRPFLA
ncbi:MAG: hypothetical protein U0271_33920 [Polyangiaceae bacterium]